MRNKRCYNCGTKITLDNLSKEVSIGHPNSGEFYRRFWCKECVPRCMLL